MKIKYVYRILVSEYSEPRLIFELDQPLVVVAGQKIQIEGHENRPRTVREVVSHLAAESDQVVCTTCIHLE